MISSDDVKKLIHERDLHAVVDLQENILSGLGDRQTARLLNEMAADDRTALLEEIPAEAAKQLLALLSKEERDVALSLLGYPEGSVGRLMSPDYLTIRQDWKVREVLDHVRIHGAESASIDTLGSSGNGWHSSSHTAPRVAIRVWTT